MVLDEAILGGYDNIVTPKNQLFCGQANKERLRMSTSAVSDAPEFVFSHESLARWDVLEKKVWERVRELVKERALSERRSLITPEDIEACIPQAVKDIAIETGIEDGGS